MCVFPNGKDRTVTVENGETVGKELVEVSIATVQVTPDQAREQNDRIDAVITEVLKEGQNGDYWRIPGTNTPTLLQPGAETLQRFFGLGRTLDDPVLGSVEVDGKFYASCWIKCSVTNMDGAVLAESIGYCDDTEAKRGFGPGSKWRGNRHTIIQMATKRAYVNAIKAATGTSNHFTTDLEDTAEAKPAAVGDRLPSDHERLLLAEIFAWRGKRSLVEAEKWIKDQPQKKQDSFAWVATKIVELLLKPGPRPFDTDTTTEDRGKDSQVTGSDIPPDTHTGYTEPSMQPPAELEPEPPLTGEVVDEGGDDVPF